MGGPDKSTLQLLLFTVSGHYYAVEISKLKDVNKQMRITEVPGSSDEISGIVNIRGELITVCELPPYMDSAVCSGATVIRLKNSPSLEAVRANTIIDIIEIQKDALIGAESNTEIPDNVSHIFVHENTTVMVLNPS